MSKKDLNDIAVIEQAIAKKYGKEAIKNPRADWDENKEQEYLQQMRALYQRTTKNDEWQEKVDVNGIKVTKKLLNRESLKSCSVCGKFPKSTMDDVCHIKFDCCNNCYIEYVEDREDRWIEGWRPNENH
tara:strand:- start:542 stop:928 length:387 start_codon:yes stop_codon:yes gene_type:complete